MPDALSGLNPGTVVVTLSTPDAQVQCACFPDAVERLLDALGFPLGNE